MLIMLSTSSIHSLYYKHGKLLYYRDLTPSERRVYDDQRRREEEVALPAMQRAYDARQQMLDEEARLKPFVIQDMASFEQACKNAGQTVNLIPSGAAFGPYELCFNAFLDYRQDQRIPVHIRMPNLIVRFGHFREQGIPREEIINLSFDQGYVLIKLMLAKALKAKIALTEQELNLISDGLKEFFKDILYKEPSKSLLQLWVAYLDQGFLRATDWY